MWRHDNAASGKPEFLNAGPQSGSSSENACLPDDIASALQKLIQMINSNHDQVADFFDKNRPLVAGRAPARLDVMGGIADYSGCAVLQLPLRESTTVLCQQSDTHDVRIISVSNDHDNVTQSVCLPLQDFFDQDSHRPHSEVAMQAYFKTLTDRHHWVAYVAGVLTVLMLHCDVRPVQGLVLLIQSTVPVGKGVSSSAALEVSTMRALCGLLGVTLSAHRQAVLCQKVENLIVGAPCGLMDQMASSCGQQDTLLNMLCQPDIVKQPVVLPNDLCVWGIDSGIRHAVSGADYESVRVAAFMGYRYLLEAAGVAARHVPANLIDDKRWHGYLANVQVVELMQHFYTQLPERVSGRAFLERFDGITDSVTRIEPDMHYSVRACTAYPIHEHFRVRLFSQLAHSARHSSNSDAQAAFMGECMYQSHAGYSSCGLDCAECDDIVARLANLGVSEGIFGARISGGGSGGAVAILAKRDAFKAVNTVAEEYAASSGCGGYVFSGSSDGASVYSLIADAS